MVAAQLMAIVCIILLDKYIEKITPALRRSSDNSQRIWLEEDDRIFFAIGEATIGRAINDKTLALRLMSTIVLDAVMLLIRRKINCITFLFMLANCFIATAKGSTTQRNMNCLDERCLARAIWARNQRRTWLKVKCLERMDSHMLHC